MRRFTLAPDRIRDGHVVFDRDETHHLVRVLRLDPGQLVVVADGHGHEYIVRVEAIGDTATGTVVRQGTSAVESPLAVTLVQGIPKGDKIEQIVRAATELGLRGVQPVITSRTVVRLELSRWRERARRWQRVAKEAAKQSGRAVVPDVHAPQPLADWLAATPTTDAGTLRLCLWEGAVRSSLTWPRRRAPWRCSWVRRAGSPARKSTSLARAGSFRSGSVPASCAARRRGRPWWRSSSSGSVISPRVLRSDERRRRLRVLRRGGGRRRSRVGLHPGGGLCPGRARRPGRQRRPGVCRGARDP
jgi:16S rRNA (uracil1498-N3)-methyltransferase